MSFNNDRIGEVQLIINALKDALDRTSRNCLNCAHFVLGPPNNRIEKCGKYGETPPPSVAVVGCAKHEDEIPF